MCFSLFPPILAFTKHYVKKKKKKKKKIQNNINILNSRI